MATQFIYNVENHRLFAKKLSELGEFCSNNYGGAVGGSTVIEVNGKGAKWLDTNAKFICAGTMIDVQTTPDEIISALSNQFEMCVLELDTAHLINDNILTDETGSVVIKTITCTNIVQTEITTGSGEYKYDITIDGDTYEYAGNTIKLSDTRYIVPLFCLLTNDGDATIMVKSMDKSSLESFLNKTAYEKLKAYAENTFVWHDGGDEPTLDGSHKKGDIGNINITNNTISSEGKIEISSNIQDVEITSLPSSTSTAARAIVIDNDRLYKANALSIEAGGTSANDRGTAKKNLGIAYGDNDGNNPSTNPPAGLSPVEGDIYLWIV